MIYRFINSLARGWRYRAQRLWMHSRNIRDQFWQQEPTLLLQMAFVVPLTGLLLIWGLVWLAPLLTGLLLAYGLALLVLAICRVIALRMGR